MTVALLIYTFFVMCLSWLRGTSRLVQWYGSRDRKFSREVQNSLVGRAMLWYALSLVSAVFSVILFYYTLEF